VQKNPWILGSFPRDSLAFCLPALLGFVLSRSLSFRKEDFAAQLALFVVYGLVDSGHVWTTLWRTHAHRPDRRDRGWRRWLPLLVTAVIAVWLLSQLPYFWPVAVAATLFHNQRQLWGIVRWYEKLAGTRRRPTAVFFHLFVWLPVLAYLTRPVNPNHFYLVPNDIPHFSSPSFFWALTYTWLLTVFAWALHEMFLYFRGTREWGRVFGLGAAALTYGWAFFGARTVMDVAFPLVLSHGAAYVAIMAQTSRRLGIPRLETRARAWVGLLATALGGGVLAVCLLERFDFADWSVAGAGRVWICLASAAYFGPVLSHYIADGWLWTGRHPEAREIFAGH
jgi:hypothetical protein